MDGHRMRGEEVLEQAFLECLQGFGAGCRGFGGLACTVANFLVTAAILPPTHRA